MIRTSSPNWITPRFCQFLHQECMTWWVQLLINFDVASVFDDKKGGFSHVHDRRKDNSQSLRLLCWNLIISAGSWSDKEFSQIFLSAHSKVPMARTQSPQNRLRLRKQNAPNQEDVSRADDPCYEVFLAPALLNDETFTSHLTLTAESMLLVVSRIIVHSTRCQTMSKWNPPGWDRWRLYVRW